MNEDEIKKTNDVKGGDESLDIELQEKSKNIAKLLNSKKIPENKQKTEEVKMLNEYIQNLTQGLPSDKNDKINALFKEIETLKKQRGKGQLNPLLEQKINLVVMNYNSLKGGTGY